MNKPREKWVVLTSERCDCKYRFNLDTSTGTVKLCVWHRNLGLRWVKWNARPPVATFADGIPGVPEPGQYAPGPPGLNAVLHSIEDPDADDIPEG